MPGLYFSAASKSDLRMTLVASAEFGNARSHNNDARTSSMASWMMTRMRGLCAVRVSLVEPGVKYKSVSLEANVGAEGLETFAVSTTAALAFTGIEVPGEPDDLNEREAPAEPNKPEVLGAPAEPDKPKGPDERDMSDVLADPCQDGRYAS